MTTMPSEDAPAQAGSQEETIAIRVRRWRQRKPVWWLLPASLGMLGCTLLSGAFALGVFGNRGAVATERPAPAVVTTAGILPGGAADPTAQAAGSNQTAEPEDRPLTIVLLGSDRRQGDGTVGRTDSIHIVSIDTDGEGVGVLSLPRDLYVNIPDRGRDRINLVFAYGSTQGERGAAELLQQTFLDNFGIQVDHYIYLDFMMFVTLIDKIGGIDVVVPYNIDDPLYPDEEFGYDPFFLEAGLQHLDGETALKYVRTRHETNDFYRARRQHQVMLAVRDRVLDFDLLPNLVTQIPSLWKSLAGSYKTDFSPEDVAALALQLKDIDEEAIRLGVVDETATLEHVTPEGASVLVPDTAKVNELIHTVLYPAQTAN
jgi:LCP family protein required for cell wall assembly